MTPSRISTRECGVYLGMNSVLELSTALAKLRWMSYSLSLPSLLLSSLGIIVVSLHVVSKIMSSLFFYHCCCGHHVSKIMSSLFSLLLSLLLWSSSLSLSSGEVAVFVIIVSLFLGRAYYQVFCVCIIDIVLLFLSALGMWFWMEPVKVKHFERKACSFL